MPHMTETDIQGAVKSAIQSAVDYIDSQIAPSQIRAQKYFDGGVDVEHEEGRSKDECRAGDCLRSLGIQ